MFTMFPPCLLTKCLAASPAIRLHRYVRVNRVHSQFARGLREPALVAPRNRNARPTCNERLRDRTPDPAAPARDQRHCIFQIHSSSTAFCALRYCHTDTKTVTSRSALLSVGQTLLSVPFDIGTAQEDRQECLSYKNRAARRLPSTTLRKGW